MKDAGTINNREYLAFILAGGPGNDPYRQITCAVDAAGEIVFSEVIEMDGAGPGGYEIRITGPGGRFELWMGEGGGDCVEIKFEDGKAAPVPALPVGPAEILEALRKWKAGPGIRESITNTGGTIIREYLPDQDAEQPAPVSTTKQ